MNNNTIEDLYKKAVIKQYEEVKNGEDYIYLNAPTRGKLNKLCWEIFETKSVSTDDKAIFNTLLGFPFDLNTKNKFRSNTNQFRPIETFLKGETDPDKIEVVDLAAILVDFQLRPFNKFRKKIDEEDLKLINELRNINVPEKEVIINESLEKNEEESFTVSNEDFVDTESETLPKKIFLNQPSVLKQSLVDIVDKSKSKKIKYFSIGAGLIFLIIMLFLAFPEKECMQWSNDHYELVHCDEPIPGNLNDVIPKDDNLLKFRKVIVCDTTTCFKPDGKAIIWYAKTANGIDFFNNHGYHPENHSSLKAVTNYILDKYVYGKGVKCDK